jgi:hypothetical protein
MNIFPPMTEIQQIFDASTLNDEKKLCRIHTKHYTIGHTIANLAMSVECVDTL